MHASQEEQRCDGARALCAMFEQPRAIAVPTFQAQHIPVLCEARDPGVGTQCSR